MKKLLPFLLLLFAFNLFSQEEDLPHYLTEKEKVMLEWYDWVTPDNFSKSIPEPPPAPVRHMAEWEELEALVVTWRSYRTIIREIVRHAKEEVKVIITFDPNHSSSSYNSQAAIESYLISGGITLDNIEFMAVPSNTVWSRDYLQSTVYANDVEDRYFVDWVYNRPRPKDDTIAYVVGEQLNTPVYTMTAPPNRLVNTGGNFMSDGMGTAFASKLVFLENEPGNSFNAGPHDEVAIDSIHQLFMGIDRYIKFETLPYDVIHHIDMHMHLLDEETIVFGEYPQGVSDGPQIEANLQFLLENHLSSFGTPYRIERIVQPPDFNGSFPSFGGNYRTYTNFVIVNKTIILPFYEEQYDTIAQRFYEELHPGYKVVGIDCNQMISALGALHCITKEVGVSDPLLIIHQRQRDIVDNSTWGDYELTATIQHRTGISAGQLYWTKDTTAGYDVLNMTLTNATTNTWSASIPHQPDGTEIFYYIQGEANSGKMQVKPIVAPSGYFNFTVTGGPPTATSEQFKLDLQPIFPNPASALTVIPLQSRERTQVKVEMTDAIGRLVDVLHDGELLPGKTNVYLDAAKYLPGTYVVHVRSESEMLNQKLIIH